MTSYSLNWILEAFKTEFMRNFHVYINNLAQIFDYCNIFFVKRLLCTCFVTILHFIKSVTVEFTEFVSMDFTSFYILNH